MSEMYPFESKQFDELYHYDGPLGVICESGRTEFRVWAPTADQVVLRLFRDGFRGSEYDTLTMKKTERGVFVIAMNENLDGVYYDYLITVDGTTKRSADPYARACGVNGKRSLVLDLRRTDPKDWSSDRAPARQSEDIIYEIHVKDFSFDPASGVRKEHQGKYAALWENGTTLNGDGEHPTCLDYLKNLGVTHIQLMPSFDYGSVDEMGSEKQFNWGYDPVNYDIPEGSYSLDPMRGELRILELKKVISSLHRNGFRVIMDVVYNHTYKLDSYLWRTVPGYYYRSDPEGNPSNGSGCGNDLASERSMCARYIKESVLYWASEYHIDGFRFDLMALMDVPLLNEIQSELDRIYGVGEKLLFGEPWAADQTSAKEGTMLADKDHLKNLDPKLGAFCDATRDAVKGSLLASDSKGFVNGGGITVEELKNCLTGWSISDDPKFSVRSPYQTITYVSSHDDWTLFDKLVYSMSADKDFNTNDPELIRANKLAAAIYFSCQGHLFLLSGEEFGRTKQGILNSFSSSPEINCLDWTRAWENKELVDYYRGLIALRKQLPGLCDKSDTAAKNIMSVTEEAENCISARVHNGESKWKELFLVFSAAEENVTVRLPEGEWECLVDGNASDLWKSPECVSGEIEIEPLTARLFGSHNQ